MNDHNREFAEMISKDQHLRQIDYQEELSDLQNRIAFWSFVMVISFLIIIDAAIRDESIHPLSLVCIAFAFWRLNKLLPQRHIRLNKWITRRK